MGPFNLQPVLNSYWAAGLLSVGLVALLWLRPGFGRLTARRRVWLLALRVGIVVCIVIALLRPTIVHTLSIPQSASIVLMYDTSRSMRLPDAAGDKSRWDAEVAALKTAAPLLTELDRDFDIKVYGYDSQLHPTTLKAGVLDLPAEPKGDETDIGTSIDRALRRELGRRLAAVIVLGDGVETANDPKVEIHDAGRELARMGTPLYAVAFGPAGDATQSRDVTIENLPEQYTVFVKNELQVQGVLRVRGYVNQPIPVELTIEDPSGKKRVLGPQSLVAREDGQQLSVEMNFTPDVAGQYKLTLRGRTNLANW